MIVIIPSGSQAPVAVAQLLDVRRHSSDMHVLKFLLKIGGWVFIGIAVIDLTITFFIYHHTRTFVESATRTQATIVKLLDRPEGDSGSTYYPVFRFQDSKGQTHQVDSSSGQYPPAYEVGDKVTVLYQPDNPKNAEIDTFWNVWIWSVFFAASGIIELLVGLGQFLIVYFIGGYEHKRAVVPAA